MSLTPAADGTHVRTFESSRLEGLCVGDSLYLSNESDMTASCSRCCGPLPASIPSSPRGSAHRQPPKAGVCIPPRQLSLGAGACSAFTHSGQTCQRIRSPHAPLSNRRSRVVYTPRPPPSPLCTFCTDSRVPRGLKLCSSRLRHYLLLYLTISLCWPLPLAVSHVTPS